MHRSESTPLPPQYAVVSAPRIGILGGGQLAKMTAMAAAEIGYEVLILERQDDFPANSLDTHALIGDWNDPAWVLKLASMVDVVTLENEFIEPEALRSITAHGHTLWPTVETVALVQDKVQQKRAFAGAGIPVPRWAEVSNQADVAGFGFPSVLKKRRNGYDGKGNATVLMPSDLVQAWQRLDGGQSSLYVEEYCSFTMELAVIVTRGQDGSIACYPVVETVNRNHICHVVKAPAPVSAVIADRVKDLAILAVQSINGVGSFGVEFFLLKDGTLVLNEIAPRVHNTGHYTIEACASSQFENHVRAIAGLPLGSTEMVAPAACMVNLLGYGDGPGIPRGLGQALAVPGAHVHVYGKSRSQRGRKMGHVTALGRTLEEACDRAQQAADCIQFGGE